jgi:type IV pilus assembly protein PilW
MKRSRGFSMVELMVAITLALLVTTGVLSVFIGSRNAFQATAGTATLSDSGRFALNYIETAVRGAGYLACSPPTRTISVLNPGPTPLYYAPAGPSLFFQPLSGFQAVATGVGDAYAVGTATGALTDWTPTLDTQFPPAATAIGAPVKNSDVLVVRSSATRSPTAFVTAIVDGANNFTINTNAPNFLVPGQLAVISDCAKAVLFQVSGVAIGGSSTVVTHIAGGAPGNVNSSFTPAAGGLISFGQGSEVTPLSTVAYYIGTGSDGDNSLFSYELQANNVFQINELVPDIEAMQILYGLDTTGSLTVSQYVPANLVADFTTVMSVKVALLAAGPLGSARTPAAAPQYNLLGTTVTAPLDTRARQVFEVTITARTTAT